MKSNLTLTTSRDAIEAQLSFQPRKHTLYRLPLLAQSPSFGCVEEFTVGCPKLLQMSMSRVSGASNLMIK